MKKLFATFLLLALLGSTAQAEEVRFLPHPKIKVNKVKNFDFASGIDSPVWQKQPVHDLKFYISKVQDINCSPLEKGEVRYLYDEKYFYIRADFTDSDVITSAEAHGGPFYLYGDLLEVFIKPVESNYYWEIYGTPNKFRTRYYYPARSMVGLPSGFALNDCPVLVDAKVEGTLNDPSDVDKSWRVLLAVPRSELEKNGLKFAPGSRWTVFAARYNYGRHIPDRELSSFPQCALTYHANEYYAEIEFAE